MVQNELISKIKSYDPDLNVQLIEKAYDFALSAHKSQRRHSGDPYISHPLAVADILLSLKLDTSTIVTGLLHDTLEDTLTTENDLKDVFAYESTPNFVYSSATDESILVYFNADSSNPFLQFRFINSSGSIITSSQYDSASLYMRSWNSFIEYGHKI